MIDYKAAPISRMVLNDKLLPDIYKLTIDKISSQNKTPYVVVVARVPKTIEEYNSDSPELVDVPGVCVPPEHINEAGLIVLSVTGTSVRNYIASEDKVSFNATFSNKPAYICFPYYRILSVYPKGTKVSTDLDVLGFTNETASRPLTENERNLISETNPLVVTKSKRAQFLRVVESKKPD